MTLLALDSRWQRLMDPDYVSAGGKTFGGLVDIGFEAPDAWPHATPAETGEEVVELGADKLSADLCRLDDTHYLRVILPLPVRGAEEAALFSLWAAVSPEDFARYLADWQGTAEAPFTTAPAWLMTDLPGYESDTPLHGTLTAQDEGVPRLTLDGTEPLAAAQAEGISFDALLDLYAALGTDLRPHLKG